MRPEKFKSQTQNFFDSRYLCSECCESPEIKYLQKWSRWAEPPKRRRGRRKRGCSGAAVQKIKHQRMRRFFGEPQEGKNRTGSIPYFAPMVLICDSKILSLKKIGAGEGNRTPVASLEGWSSTIELHLQIIA